jgi:hypothetical protein
LDAPAALVFAVIVGLVCAPIGRAIGYRKGYGEVGFYLGLLLGLLGLAIIGMAAIADTRPHLAFDPDTCPGCALISPTTPSSGPTASAG